MREAPPSNVDVIKMQREVFEWAEVHGLPFFAPVGGADGGATLANSIGDIGIDCVDST